jgi:hypothetical protein
MPDHPHCSTHPAVELVCLACLGARGGSATTEKKRAAAAANGKKGGRPKGSKAATSGGT